MNYFITGAVCFIAGAIYGKFHEPINTGIVKAFNWVKTQIKARREE